MDTLRQSYFNSALLYLLLMHYKEYIVNWMITLTLTTITNVEDLGSGQHVSFMVFDVIFIIVHGSLIILYLIMDIQIMAVSPLHMMYVIIYFFV